MTSLQLRIALRQASPPAGEALVVNVGPELVRLWRTGCSLGDETLSFSIDTSDGPIEIRRRPQVYTVNRPAFVEIEASGTYHITFDLGDGQWTPSPPGAPLSLTARFAIPDSEDARSYAVWTGAIASAPVVLESS